MQEVWRNFWNNWLKVGEKEEANGESGRGGPKGKEDAPWAGVLTLVVDVEQVSWFLKNGERLGGGVENGVESALLPEEPACISRDFEDGTESGGISIGDAAIECRFHQAGELAFFLGIHGCRHEV